MLRKLWLGPFLTTLVLTATLRAVQLPVPAQSDFSKAVESFKQRNFAAAIETLQKLEKNFPPSFEVQHLLAIVLDLNNQAEDANRHFEQAVQLNPSSVQARTNFGASLVRLGKTGEARHQFEAALKLDPANATAAFNLGTTLLNGGTVREACPWLEKAYQAQPEVYQNAYQLAFCRFITGDLEEADKVLQKVGAVGGPHLEYQLLKALTEKALGRPQASAQTITDLLALLPGKPEIYQQVTLLLFAQGMFSEAIPLLEAAKSRFPESPEVLRSLAQAQLQAGQTEKARQNAERSQQLKENDQIHLLLAEISEASEEPANAVRHYQQAIRLNSVESNWYEFGYYFLSHWNWEAAEQIFQGALRDFPDSWRLLLGLGGAAMGLGKSEEASQAFIHATQVEPDQVLGYQLLSEALPDSKDSFEGAMERFRDFYSRHPEDPRAAYFLALSRQQEAERKGETDCCVEDVKLLQSAISAQPEYFEAHLLLGEIFFERGQWQEAASALSQAVTIDPAHVQAHYKLGLALQRAGNSDQARAQLEIYQQLKKAQDSAVSERMSNTRKLIIELNQP